VDWTHNGRRGGGIPRGMSVLRASAVGIAMAGWLSVGACAPTYETTPDPLPPGAVFQGAGEVFAPGSLAVRVIDLFEGQRGAPRPVRILAPTGMGTYPLVHFSHGFLSDRRAYTEVLTAVASHGFVVVAPQMYEPDGVPLGKPTAASEAADAARVVAWARRAAGAVAGVALDPRPPALVGHSRGGKVLWLLHLAERVESRALVGIDPVDGRGGPLLSAQPEALPGPIDRAPPTLVLGMELGPRGATPCAPAADGYRHFFERSPAGTRLLVVAGHGHADMLDETAARAARGLCEGGPMREGVRRAVAGWIVSFLRAHLQDVAGAEAPLDDPSRAPVPTTGERR
jgi:chlorophyllase